MNDADTISVGLNEAGCDGSLHVVEMSSGRELSVNADEPVIMASVVKVPIALEFYAQATEGKIDPGAMVDIKPQTATPGPVGISCFQDSVHISLRDLAHLMLTVSDNAATDVITAAVGIDRINNRLRACGCLATTVVSTLGAMLDRVGADMGFTGYRHFLEACQGLHGEAARVQGLDANRLSASSAFDSQGASRTTARDMTRLLTRIWRGDAADPSSCSRVQVVMSQQLTRRFEAAGPDGSLIAAKSGSLFGRVRNEIGVVQWPDGQAYAIAIFTRAHQPFCGTSAINIQIGSAVRTAINALRA
jgi:beta-lactamase class A